MGNDLVFLFTAAFYVSVRKYDVLLSTLVVFSRSLTTVTEELLMSSTTYTAAVFNFSN